MKILIIGLEGAEPELLFGDERLTNFRRLMEGGCYGRLESVVPSTTVPTWMCMATSQDPGMLGVYGCRNRTDYSYNSPAVVGSQAVPAGTIWDQVARAGKRTILHSVPPSYPPLHINGICVGCYMTPAPAPHVYTYPASVQAEIAQLVGAYPLDVPGFRTNRKDWLKEEIYATSRKHFTVVQHLLQHTDWDYCQCLEIGLDRLQRGFWKFHDPQHVSYTPGNPYQTLIRDYYLYLDEELGKIFDVLHDETAVVVLSNHGVQRLDGGFCVNEWLIRQGLLMLHEYPTEITPFSKLNVNWEKTRVWSEGGAYARVFFNVKGREPRGTIDKADYEMFREDVKAMFEGTVGDQGLPLGACVWKPEETYKAIRNVAPDLIVHFGGPAWQALDGVGYQTLFVQENDTELAGCSCTPFGSFILAAPNNPVYGEVEGVHLLDITPTLLELGGYEIPGAMQGKLLVAGRTFGAGVDTGMTADDEEAMRERLRGLGYIA